jgi:DNA primase
VYTNIHNNVPSIFDVLRDEVLLDRIVEKNGHRKAFCVAHDDTEPPDMHLYDDHAHCFACGFHGDVVSVWGKQQGIERPFNAALDLAREFQVQLPELSEEGRQQAEARRAREEDLLALAKERLAQLDDHPEVREWWEGRGFGPELRERFLLGTTEDSEWATIPFWVRGGRIAGTIRRVIVERKGGTKYKLPKAESFPDGHRPLFIPAPISGDTCLLEGYIDALTVAATGKSVVAVGGTGISEVQSAELRSLPAGRLYILPDNDGGEGDQAARSWARMFYPKTRIAPPDYGDGNKDPADLFASEAGGADGLREHLDRLIKGALDPIDLEVEQVNEFSDRREQFVYATEHIIPMLTRVGPPAVQDATADIVVEGTKIKKSWLNNALKDERERLVGEEMQRLVKRMEAKQEAEREEYRARVAEAQTEIDDLLEPGVLGRFRKAAAEMHGVRRDEEALELAILVAAGAQLSPLPNGRPLGASVLITGPAGRGKNHLFDAAVRPMPPEFFFAFEIASGQSLYYAADEDPDFLRHTFAYPNEIEGAEALWEFLRPMLSKGRATKIVTAKDADGNMTTRTIIVEGPVTLAVPTVRNVTDEQLQTRLLVAELPDYPGRVKEHAQELSALHHPDAAEEDFSREQFLWREALRQLTAVRRVVFPLRHENFAFDDDAVSHGARMWANILSLMDTAAWLEQKNRRVVKLKSGTMAVEATPADYEVAYRIFTKVAKRTVFNLSDTHRKILDGLHELHQGDPRALGFPQRRIATAAGVGLGTVSDNKTFLVTSAKFLKEVEGAGLSLVDGAEPSWWAEGTLTTGLPNPEQVWRWWEERDPEPPEGAERAEQPDTGQDPAEQADSGVRNAAEHEPNASPNGSVSAEHAERVRNVFAERLNTESRSESEESEGVRTFGTFGALEDDEDEL